MHTYVRLLKSDTGIGGAADAELHVPKVHVEQKHAAKSGNTGLAVMWV
jgi:hypothetical protein